MSFDIILIYSSKDKAIADLISGRALAWNITCGQVEQDFLPSRAAASAIVQSAGGAAMLLLVAPSGAVPPESATSLGYLILPAQVTEAQGEITFAFAETCWIAATPPPTEQALEPVFRTFEKMRKAPTLTSVASVPSAPVALAALFKSPSDGGLQPIRVVGTDQVPPIDVQAPQSTGKRFDGVLAAGIVGVVAVLLLAGTYFAIPPILNNLGDRAYNRAMVDRNPYGIAAFCCYFVGAHLGNATSQYDLASAYTSNFQDADATLTTTTEHPDWVDYWYQKAAAQNNPDALYALANEAKSSSDDKVKATADDLIKKAFAAFQQGADKGDLDCMTGLGSMYEAGDGTALDYDKARELYQRASDRGYDFADEYLASMYVSGHGVAKDIEKARALYQKAIADGDPSAINSLNVAPFTGPAPAAPAPADATTPATPAPANP